MNSGDPWAQSGWVIRRLSMSSSMPGFSISAVFLVHQGASWSLCSQKDSVFPAKRGKFGGVKVLSSYYSYFFTLIDLCSPSQLYNVKKLGCSVGKFILCSVLDFQNMNLSCFCLLELIPTCVPNCKWNTLNLNLSQLSKHRCSLSGVWFHHSNPTSSLLLSHRA